MATTVHTLSTHILLTNPSLRGETWSPTKPNPSPTTTNLKPHGTAAAAMASPLLKPHSHCPARLHSANIHTSEGRSGLRSSWRLKAFPGDTVWPLMVTMVQHVEGQRDYVVHKTIWHLNDISIKNVYAFYMMFTVWGCCFFGSMKDPFYDSEGYRGDGGDGSAHWYYDKQEDIEAAAREELLREELLEEIEQRVGGLRELEEAGKEEQYTK